MTTTGTVLQVSCCLWCQHMPVAQVLALPRQRSLAVQLLPARGPWVWGLSPGGCSPMGLTSQRSLAGTQTPSKFCNSIFFTGSNRGINLQAHPNLAAAAF